MTKGGAALRSVLQRSIQLLGPQVLLCRQLHRRAEDVDLRFFFVAQPLELLLADPVHGLVETLVHLPLRLAPRGGGAPNPCAARRPEPRRLARFGEEGADRAFDGHSVPTHSSSSSSSPSSPHSPSQPTGSSPCSA